MQPKKIAVVLATGLSLTIPSVHAADIGGLLGSALGQISRQLDPGLADVFRSITEVVVGAVPQGSKYSAAADQVVMYSTESCGYCQRARKYMQSQGISFVERDVVRDQAAKAELLQLNPKGGVPVILMGSQKMIGYDEARFKQAYAQFQAGFSKPQASAQGHEAGASLGVGDVLVARIAKVKVLGRPDAAAQPIGFLQKNEEMVALGGVQGDFVKIKAAEHEGWVERALISKP